MKALCEATIRLAVEIADSTARADVECYCVPHALKPTAWYDTKKVDAEDRQCVDEALLYLDLRGLIERAPNAPHIVSFHEVAA